LSTRAATPRARANGGAPWVSVLSLGGERTDTSNALGDAHGGALGADAAASGADAFTLVSARAGVRLLIQHGDPSDAGAALLSLAMCEPLVCARNRTLDYADAATFVDDGAFDDAAAQNVGTGPAALNGRAHAGTRCIQWARRSARPRCARVSATRRAAGDRRARAAWRERATPRLRRALRRALRADATPLPLRAVAPRADVAFTPLAPAGARVARAGAYPDAYAVADGALAGDSGSGSGVTELTFRAPLDGLGAPRLRLVLTGRAGGMLRNESLAPSTNIALTLPRGVLEAVGGDAPLTLPVAGLDGGGDAAAAAPTRPSLDTAGAASVLWAVRALVRARCDRRRRRRRARRRRAAARCARAATDRRGAGRRRRARLVARVVARCARAHLHTLGFARRGRHGDPAAAGLRQRWRPARAQRHGQRGARHVAVGAKDAERRHEERAVREPRSAVATSSRHARAPPPPLPE
jgi:hypothetical protein